LATRTQQKPADIALRRMTAQDLDSVVALDAANSGRSRRFYFERRLKVALAQPALHVQFSAEQDGKFVGFMMARELLGQFGRAEPALRLEAMGVARGEQGHGIGTALLAKLESEAGRMGVPAIRTTASWRDHAIMQFFDRAGFELARSVVLDCAVHSQRLTAHEGDKVLAPAHLTGFSASEVDYSAAAGNDFEALARDKVDVRTLTVGDTDDIVRIDQKATGRRRESYIQELVEEAMTDSAVRVSLVARVDGIAVGFVMARTDFGDFGRAEPAAVLDTIGVDPDYSHHGVGHALLSQLFVNLEGLRVERVETSVARENFGLLGFLYDIGFEPSPRLSFVKRVA
jgi:ribosomal protein S18 acetylase RimI-like enzyme